MGDEGVGVHVANQLMKMSLPAGVEVIDGGTAGFGLFNWVLNTQRLIIIDAVKGGGEPGTIYRFDIDDIHSFPDAFKTSLHQLGIEEILQLAEIVGTLPTTTIIGIEPAEIRPSMNLSGAVAAKLPRIIELVLEEIGPKT